MTGGPGHYLEAERLAEAYKTAISDAEAMPAETMMHADERIVAMSNARSLLDKAQVHATLAVVGVLVDTGQFGNSGRFAVWQRATRTEQDEPLVVPA